MSQITRPNGLGFLSQSDCSRQGPGNSSFSPLASYCVRDPLAESRKEERWPERYHDSSLVQFFVNVFSVSSSGSR